MAQDYRFGRFHVLAAARELRAGDAPVELPARAFDCLVYLIDHRERAVGRDELIAAVWGRADVGETLLNHTILKIRRTLDSDGQEFIRTVPRFGYRWIGILDGDANGSLPSESLGTEERASPTASPLTSARAPAKRPFRVWWLLLFALATLTIILASLKLARHPAEAPQETLAAIQPAAPTIALPALVLPAEIDAPDEWSWLRFGIMDLIANRLRNGALRTAPSESVVALLKQRGMGKGDALLHDPELASVAAMRVLPRVRFDQGRWNVQLDAAGSQYNFSVEAQAGDPISAAREAANRLLAKVGLAPGAIGEASSPALDDLMQRSGAAMLADQLDQARTLIDQAPAEVKDAPAMQQRMAQIELRAGAYDAVEKRLLALLDRLDAKHDQALRARALITLASSYVRRNQFDKADDAYAEAIALRGDAKDPEVLGIAYLGRGIVLAQKGEFDNAIAELGRARIELETAGDPLGVAQVDVNLGDFQVMRHRPADAVPMLENAARQFERLGAREGLVHALIGIADVERDLLDPAAALATSERFWPAQAHTSNPRMQWTATRARVEALVANARLRDADLLIESVRTQSDPARDVAVRAQIEAVASEVAMLRGDDVAASRLAAVALTPALLDSDKTFYARTLLLQARALRGAKDAAGASAATQRLRELATPANDAVLSLYAGLAQAELDWAEERRDTALQGFAAAMKQAEALNVPELLVAVGAPYADALIDVGHIDEARSVSGRIAPWADHDARAAWVRVRLFRALGQADAERNARVVAVRLSGEGAIGDPDSR